MEGALKAHPEGIVTNNPHGHALSAWGPRAHPALGSGGQWHDLPLGMLMTNPITIIRPDRIERYEVTRDTMIGGWLVDGATARGVSGDGPGIDARGRDVFSGE